MLPPPPTSTLFPYTTLFRSAPKECATCMLSNRAAWDMQTQSKLSLSRAKAYNFLPLDRKSTRLNSSHVSISYAVFCLKKKIIRARHAQLIHYFNLTFKLSNL